MSFPVEISQYIFQYLEPAHLAAASLVCKSWHQTIDQRFIKTYVKSLSNSQMEKVHTSFFSHFLPFFKPEQVFHISEKKISRHFLHPLTETEENKTNLRIAKLAASLGWFHEIVLLNMESYIDHCDSTNMEFRKQFIESLDYIHLLILGARYPSISIKKNTSSDTVSLISKEESMSLKWYEAFKRIADVIKYDMVNLNKISSKFSHGLFRSIFGKYEIKHIMEPKGKPNLFMQHNVFLKSLFSVVNVELLTSEIPQLFIRSKKQYNSLEKLLENTLLEIEETTFYGDLGNLDPGSDKIKFITVKLGKKK